ncbi:MAG: histidine kinase [Flavipsychrobacter sp.]
MTRRLYFSFFQFTLFLFIQYIAAGQSIHTKHFTKKDGLPSAAVYMCHQDLDGYIWMATANGLSRYDGKEFKNYNQENGTLLNNIVITINNDYENNIWAKAYFGPPEFSVIKKNKTIKHLDSSAYTLHDQGQHLLEKLYAKKSQTAYIIGSYSLMSIKKGRKPAYVKTSLAKIISIFETDNGNVYTTEGQSIYRINDTIIECYQKNIFNSHCSKLAYYKGFLYAQIKDSIHIYKDCLGSFIHTKAYKQTKTAANLHANEHGLWIAYDNERKINLLKQYDFLSSPVEVELPGLVNRVLTDNDQGLWICTFDNGVVYIPNPNIISYSVKEGLSSQTVLAIDAINENKIWIGHRSGEVDILTKDNNHIKAKKRFYIKDSFPGYSYIEDIITHKENTYILSRGKFHKIERGQLKEIFKTNSTYKSFQVINDSLIGIGSTAYFILNTRTKKQKKYSIGRIFCQSKDSDGNIWLGGLNGLYVFNPVIDNAPRKITYIDSGTVHALSIQNKFIWLSLNTRLYLINKDSVLKEFSKDEDQLPKSIIGKIATQNNHIWLGSVDGLFYGSFNYDSLTFNNSRLINHNDGLLTDEVSTIKAYDSATYIGTYSNGFFSTTPNDTSSINYVISDIKFEELKSNKIFSSDSISIDYSKEGIEIEFHTAALKYHDEIFYRYKLEPFHTEWRTTTNNIIQYTNIPPGRYDFLIEVQDRRPNTTSTLSTTHIYIEPLFWQTSWFKLLIGLLLLLLISPLFYWYYRYLKKQTKRQIERDRFIAKTRLKTLKAQIKPHFIFNSLNAMQDYIYTNSRDDVAKLLQNFASLIRKGLHFSDNDFVTINEEILFLEKYLSLEKIKCEDCFDYEIKAPQAIRLLNIPSLITQPFVENAVVHGQSKNKHSFISIVYSIEENNITCTIKDNGIGIKKSQQRKKGNTSKGMGISMERVDYFKMGLNVDINIQIEDLSENNSNTTGTCITITVNNSANKQKK